MCRLLTRLRLWTFQSTRGLMMMTCRTSTLSWMKIFWLPSLATNMTYGPGRRGAAPQLGWLHHHPRLFQGKLHTRMLNPLTWTMCRPLAPIVMPEMEKSEYELVRLANIEEKEAEFLRIFGYPLDQSMYKY